MNLTQITTLCVTKYSLGQTLSRRWKSSKLFKAQVIEPQAGILHALDQLP